MPALNSHLQLMQRRPPLQLAAPAAQAWQSSHLFRLHCGTGGRRGRSDASPTEQAGLLAAALQARKLCCKQPRPAGAPAHSQHAPLPWCSRLFLRLRSSSSRIPCTPWHCRRTGSSACQRTSARTCAPRCSRRRRCRPGIWRSCQGRRPCRRQRGAGMTQGSTAGTFCSPSHTPRRPCPGI